MRTLVGAGLAVGLLAFAADEARAQYYPYAPPPPPPPGYYPPPPGYYPRRVGYHCDAFLPGPYGGRREYCPIIEPRPLGRPCECPPPPGYPPPRGRVVP